MCQASHLASHRAGNQLDGTTQSEIFRSMPTTDCVYGGQATSSLLSSAAVDETEFRRSQPGCFGFSLQGNTTASQQWPPAISFPSGTGTAGKTVADSCCCAGYIMKFWRDDAIALRRARGQGPGTTASCACARGRPKPRRPPAE
jgi:hypothetical protein